jgi:hypothetical protein
LGIASGDERADALRHLAHCDACREDLRSLTEAADLLLLATPEVEPSAGFDERVVAGLAPTASTRWTRRSVVLVAGAAIFVALACGVVVGWAVGRPDADERRYADAIEAMDGDSLRVASFDVDTPATRAVAYDGDPSWLLVTVDGGLPDGDYLVVCEYEGGWSVTPGTVSVHDGRGGWATTVHRTLGDLTSVRLQDGDGTAVADATFD